MIIRFLFLMLVCIGVYACKKGDTGDQGLQGAQGPQGPQGVKGDNGTMIYSGNDVPATSLGVNGDFYFRLSNSTFYGPKTASGWGTPVSLRGATGATGSAGAAGAPGTKILSGTVLPATTLGAVGDFYFKSDQFLLFGPKTASGWGSGVNLKGEPGAANVIYSGWMNFTTIQRDTTFDSSNFKINHILAPRMTQSIIDNGIILVYMRFFGELIPLPYTSDAGSNGVGPEKTNTISFFPRSRVIYLTRYTHDNSASLGFGTLQFRYVIVAGGALATLKNKNIDLSNPFAVDKALQEIKL